MGRVANLSPMGLYNWDSSIFDLMVIPEALDRETLIMNILAETAELEVLYPNPIVFKNLLGVWSRKQIDVWNRLYQTTQYEYNPIENYNRFETGTDGTTGTTTHGGTDTSNETVTHGGTDTKHVTNTHSGTDTTTGSTTYGGTDTKTQTREEGGTETESGEFATETGGTDAVTLDETKGHWIAGYDAPAPTAQDDGLFKQTRDENNGTTTTNYGKTEEGSGSKETAFGKTEDITDSTTYGKTESVSDSVRYGKVETTDETVEHGETETKQGSITHGETVTTENDGEHTIHAHGNIGVTTTQNMIRQQRQIELFNIYDIIKEDFKMRFCILVY